MHLLFLFLSSSAKNRKARRCCCTAARTAAVTHYLLFSVFPKQMFLKLHILLSAFHPTDYRDCTTFDGIKMALNSCLTGDEHVSCLWKRIKSANTWRRTGQRARLPPLILFVLVFAHILLFPSCVGPISCVNWQPHWRKLPAHPIIPTIRSPVGKVEKASWVEVGEMGGSFFFYCKTGQLKQRRMGKVGALAWIFADVNNRRFKASKLRSPDSPHVAKRRVSPQS